MDLVDFLIKDYTYAFSFLKFILQFIVELVYDHANVLSSYIHFERKHGIPHARVDGLALIENSVDRPDWRVEAQDLWNLNA